MSVDNPQIGTNGSSSADSEDGIPSGLTLRRRLPGHGSIIGRFAWSPCGTRLASPSLDGLVRIWDTESGALLQEIVAHETRAYCVDWSPSGDQLVSVGDKGNVRIWDATSGANVWEQQHHTQDVFSVSWSPDGKQLATAGADFSICICDAVSGELQRRLKASFRLVTSVAWSPDGCRLAVGTDDRGGFSTKTTDSSALSESAPPGELAIRLVGDTYHGWAPAGEIPGETVWIWNRRTDERLDLFAGVSARVRDVKWTPDGKYLAAGTGDNTIRMWGMDNAQTQILEGHTGTIWSISFSADGRLLASKSRDGTVRIWEMHSFRPLASFDEPTNVDLRWVPGIAFHPVQPQLATLCEHDQAIRIWDVDPIELEKSAEATLQYTGAKIVLVGESNVGKSCLAMRLAEDRFPESREFGSTHGMQFLKVPATSLNAASETIVGERREIILWDMGGQDEYRIVHQLFLENTTLALVLFDPTRGKSALDEVEGWNKQLEKQLQDRKVVKLLVGAKVDQPRDSIDRRAVERLRESCGFAEYIETSALTERGIDELRQAIDRHLDWNSLTTVRRPRLFQRIRDIVEDYRLAGETVMFVEDLQRKLRNELGDEDDDIAAVQVVIDQLAMQGEIATTELRNGEQAVILQVPIVEQYACSLVLAARNNPRAIPALEVLDLSSPNHAMPGMKSENRLSRAQERIVLECVAQLLVQRAICFEHQGMLIFPTLLAPTHFVQQEGEPRGVSLYYDFAGAIDNIYASLVAWLVIAKEFGELRLWEDRAEFEHADHGACGLRKVERKRGFAHLDVYFENETPNELQRRFIDFVETHLRQRGMNVVERLKIVCDKCGYSIPLEAAQQRFAEGYTDVVCTMCEQRLLLSTGVRRDADADEEIKANTIALRTRIQKDVVESAESVKQRAFSLTDEQHAQYGPIRILHLSDLHFSAESAPERALQWLSDDVRKGRGLGFEQLDYLIISGDMTDCATVAGWEKAREFVSLLIDRFSLSADRCIFVPGNHDVLELDEAYKLRTRFDESSAEHWVRAGDFYAVRDDTEWAKRFQPFSDNFFHKILQRPYPLDFALQGMPILYPEAGLQFMALNSAWEIDQFHRRRSGVHPSAVARLIDRADAQLKTARESGQLPAEAGVVRIGVWHHATAGPDAIQNRDFLSHLMNNGVRLCLCGDVHEMRRDLVRYWHKDRMYVVGAGSFGAPREGLPDATPRLYNLLEVERDLRRVRIHTRCQTRTDGAWEGSYLWDDPNGEGKLAYFDIPLQA